jgi:hypothetical protein
MSLISGSVREAGDSRPADVILLYANGDPVLFPSAQARPNAATLSNLPANTANAFIVVAANPNRAERGVWIFNDSTKSLRVAYGNVCNSTHFTAIVPAGTAWQQEDDYTGDFSGQMVAAAASGAVLRITEVTRP